MNLNIEELVQNNPIKNFNEMYQKEFIEQLKQHFTTITHQTFLTHYLGYLRYDYYNDFVIDLDDVWEWLQINSKYKAKQIVKKHFTVNKNYVLLQTDESPKKRGGHNKEMIKMNMYSFQVFCIKSGTKKGELIYDSIQILERILNHLCLERYNERFQNDDPQLQPQNQEQLENQQEEPKIIKLIKEKEFLQKKIQEKDDITNNMYKELIHSYKEMSENISRLEENIKRLIFTKK